MPRYISPRNTVIRTRFAGPVLAHDDAWRLAADDLVTGGVAVVVATHGGRAHAFVLSEDPEVHAGALASRLAGPLLGGEGGGMHGKAHCAGPDIVGKSDAHELAATFEQAVAELLRHDELGLFHPDGCGTFDPEDGVEVDATDAAIAAALAGVRR